MRKILMLVALGLAGLSSCAATLDIPATAPTHLNGGSCPSPTLAPAPPTWPMFMHFAWSGPAAGEDSISCLPGQPVRLTRAVPPGTYTVRGWASNAYGAGCDTTITRIAGDRPAVPSFQ